MKDLLQNIIKTIAQAFIEFRNLIENPSSIKSYLISMGWNPNDIQPINFESAISNFKNSINQLESLIENLSSLNSSNTEEIVGIIEDCYDTINNIYEILNLSINNNASSFPLFPFNQPQFWNEFGESIIDKIIISYLENNYKIVFSIFIIFGIIKFENIFPNESGRIPYVKKSLVWENLLKLLTDPSNLISTLYNWEPNVVNYEKIFDNISIFVNTYGFESYNRILNEATYLNFNSNLTPHTVNNLKELNISFLEQILAGNNYWKIGARIAPSENLGAIDGIILIPELIGLVDYTFNLSPNSRLELKGYFDSNNIFGIQILPDGKVKFHFSGNSNAVIGSKITYVFAPLFPKMLIGNENSSTGLYINGYETSFEIKGEIDDPEIILRIGMGDVITQPNFIFIYDPDKNDNFIKKILGDSLLNIMFQLGIRWSSKHGIGFEGNVGFTKEIPLQSKQKSEAGNFLKIPSLRIQARGGNNGAFISLGADIELDLSVIQLSVRNIGVKVSLDKKNNSSDKGLLNNLDFDFDFKFPDGVALAINAPPVKGAGFLDYNAATSTYTGGLELTFSKISFSAIGIISTKLPGGKEGYSLLIIITAEFSPIQLGMGFTLTGLGGLLGLNRTMNPDVLRSGLRDKTLDSILFPKDIINNKDTIISNIGQAFPVMEGQFMVGPMAKIGWGTPTLITIELGIILEFPEPVRLAILGVLRAILPSEDKSVLKLQINFLGIIDFTAKYLSFDASIYDSKILTFPLMGDMALRLYWGDKPNFLMSVGGFHPRYTPPPLNLPELRRLSLVLASDKNLSIGIEAYFAITSNSVQFGAKVAAKAILLKGKVEVLGALWFDILFQFSPFYFVADMGVLFSIRWKGKELLTLFVNLMLEGPNPWRAQGKGTFKILGIGISVSFDKTFGQTRTETIAPVPLDTKFSEALSHKDNWEALLPARSHQQVSWKDAADSTELIVDSGGKLRFSQRLLPLNIDLAKYGTAPISDTRKFKIQGVTGGQDGVSVSPTPMDTEKVLDLFARNEYFNMTDDEKLSKDPYEPFESGVLIGSDALSAEYAVHRKIDYENIVIDAGYRKRNPKWDLSAALMNVHLMDSYVSASALSDFVAVSDHSGPRKVAVSRAEETFVVINRENMGMATSTSFASSAEADAFLAEARVSYAGASEWYVANSYELA